MSDSETAAYDDQAALKAWASWSGRSEVRDVRRSWEPFRAGWRAGALAASGFPTRAAAREFLVMIVGADSGADDMPDAELLRRARRFAHPDAGGEMSLWIKVRKAGRMLAGESA